jgi:hypothetical protein
VIDEKKTILQTLVNAKCDIVAQTVACSACQFLFDSNNPNGCAGPLRGSGQIKKVTQAVPRFLKLSVGAQLYPEPVRICQSRA